MPASPTFDAADRPVWTPRDWLLSAGLAGAALLLYSLMLADGLLPGDSGEFQTLAWTGGHAHPSGYSLYLILARLFTRLPWLNPAARVSWQAAFMGAVTVGLAYGFGRWLTGRRAAAAAGALTLALSQTFWSQALIAEVYTTSAAALLAALWGLAVWQTTGRRRWLLAAALLTGAAPGLHLSGLFWLPAAAAALLYARRAGRRQLRRAGALVAAGLAAGLLLAAAAFWAVDQSRPPTDYFATVVGPARSALDLSAADLTRSSRRLRFAWSGAQFQFRLQDSLAGMPRAALNFLLNLRREIPWPLLPLLPLGALWLWRRRRPVAVSLFTFLGLHWLYAVNYDVWDQFVFYLPDYLVLVLCLAAGVAAAGEWRPARLTWRRPAYAYAILPLLLLWQLPGPLRARLAGAIPFPLPAYAITPYSQEQLTPAVTATIAALPPDALVFTQWSELYPLYFAAQVTGRRPDLTFIQIYQTPGSGAIPDSQRALLAAGLAARPVFLAVPLPEMIPAGAALQPEPIGGLDLWRVLPP